MRPRTVSEKLEKVMNWPKLAEAADYHAGRLANALRVPPKTLQRFFRLKFGQSVQMQLEAFRQLELERRANAGTPAKVLTIELSFKHAPHLSRAFKKAHGMTFRVWLKAHLADGASDHTGYVPKW